VRGRAVTGRPGSITAGYATTGCVTDALVLCEFIDTSGADPRYAVLSEQLLQLTILFGEGFFVSSDAAEVLLQS
jgi:hypothetical protein